MTSTDRLMTADELLHLPDDGLRHELVAGELRTMAPSGGPHGWIEWNIALPLGNYVRAHRLGRLYLGDHGFALARNPDTVLGPDVAFVRRERVLAAGEPSGFWPGAPDLVVEVISPTDRYSDVNEKIATWLAHGVRMALAVDPRRRVVAVHRPDQPVRVLTEEDVLGGEDVVPGWTLPVRDVFSDNLED
jgi:Uma2 family endonuclease